MFPVSLKRGIQAQGGFTLIEVMVALVIFLIAIIGCYTLQMNSSFSNTRSNNVASASTWAQNMAENLLCLQYTAYYTDPLLLNNHGNGSSESHLNDATPTTSDGVRYVWSDGSINTTAGTSPLYSIYWDILDNRPMNNIKQIHIIVVRNGGINSGQLYTQDYFKLGPI